MTTTRSAVRLNYVSATLVALAAAVALPVLVHLLPPVGGLPAGARLLPIFFAPLIAVLVRQPAAALTAAVAAPLLNHLLTGLPDAAMLPVLTLQLLIFTGVAALLASRRFLTVLAPVAYVLAYWLTPVVLRVFGGEAGPVQPLGTLLTNAWPGLLALAVLALAVESWRKQ